MKKSKLLKEDFTKRIYSTDNEENLIIEFLDAFEVKGSSILMPGKGVINTTLFRRLYEYLEGYHIPTYFVRVLSEKEVLVRTSVPLTFKAVISNFITPLLVERFGFEVDRELMHPVVEFFLNDSEHEYPLINASHAIAFGLVDADGMSQVTRLSAKINAVLKSFFLRREMKLVAFELEFGTIKNKVIVNSELNLDSISLIDSKSNRKYDRSLYELEKSEVAKAIEELNQKLVGENII